MLVTSKQCHECGAAVSAANLWVNSTGCSGQFHVVFEHFNSFMTEFPII